MKLEIGKFYKTRYGRKVLLESICDDDVRCVILVGSKPHKVWNDHLIAEWQEEVEPETAPAPTTTRAHILDTAKEYVTKDRQATHGKPEDTFGLIATYWSAHLDTLVESSDVAAMMALLKLARAKQNPGNQDNWIDLAGYAACAGELAK